MPTREADLKTEIAALVPVLGEFEEVSDTEPPMSVSDFLVIALPKPAKLPAASVEAACASFYGIEPGIYQVFCSASNRMVSKLYTGA